MERGCHGLFSQTRIAAGLSVFTLWNSLLIKSFQKYYVLFHRVNPRCEASVASAFY